MAFFARTELVRAYRVGDLVDDASKLPRSASHFQWEKEARLIGEFEYMIETLDGNRFVFDIRTGGIVSESRPGRAPRQRLRVILAAVGGVALAWLVYRADKRPRRAPARDSAL